MKLHPEFFALLLCTSLAVTGCNSKPDTDAHEEEAHATQPKPAPVAIPPPTPGPLDTDFATLMQVHHQTGVALAQVELSFGKVPELKDAARRIIRDEQAEIKQFQRWLKANTRK